MSIHRKVIAINNTNAILHKLALEAPRCLEDMIGRKMFLVSGERTARLGAIRREMFESIPKIEYTAAGGGKGYPTMLWLDRYGERLFMRVKMCFSGGSYDDKTSYTIYQEASTLIGWMEGDKLAKLVPVEEVEELMLVDVAEQERLIAEYKAAEKALFEMKLKIYSGLRPWALH